MNKNKLLSLVFSFFVFIPVSLATSGACSNHGGVSCSTTPDIDNSPICNDGWKDSTTNYWNLAECKDYLCQSQVVLRDSLIQKAKDSGSLDIGVSKLCSGTGGFSSLSMCMSLRQQEINAVYNSINSQVYAARSICYSNTQSNSCGINSTLNSSDGKCYCNTNFTWSTQMKSCISLSDSCKETYGLNSQSVGGIQSDSSFSCVCSTGYIFNYSKTACIGSTTNTSIISDKQSTPNNSTNISSFSDVLSSYKYITAIGFVKQKNIVNGYSDGTYKPDNKINRAEFTKILINYKFPDADKTQKNCFKDVEGWYEPYVCFAKNKGIIEGYLDGTFKPERNITVPEALKITLLATQDKVSNVVSGEWYQKYLFYANLNNLMPQEWQNISYEITRGEMAEHILRLSNLTDPKI